MLDSAADPRARLAELLAQARAAAGMTQTEAARRMGWTQSKIGKMETAKSRVKASDLTRLLVLYQVSDGGCREAMALVESAQPGSVAGSRPDPAYLRMLAMEPEAIEILGLHSERIPAVLQSEYYLLRQYQAAHDGTEKSILMEHRADRESLLSADNQLQEYRVVLSESSLWRMPGGATRTGIRDQVEHLLALIEKHARLRLRISPFNAPIAFMPSDLTVLKFTDSKRDAVFLENGQTGRIYKERARVEENTKLWHSVYHTALPEDATRKYLGGLIT